jgi:hypothetical protein
MHRVTHENEIIIPTIDEIYHEIKNWNLMYLYDLIYYYVI